MKRLLFALLVSAAMAAAAGVEGRWTGEITPAARKQNTKKGGPARPTIVTLILKTSAGQLSGTVEAGGGRRSIPMQIENARLEGDSFSFTTVRKNKKGEVKWSWRGAVKGDEMNVTRTREGARRGQSFVARKAS